MTSRYPLEGKVAVLTGATGGMGSVIARELVSGGARVIAVVRDPLRADGLVAQLAGEAGPGELEILAGDLSLRQGIIDTSRAILDRHDVLHLLINNAGAHFRDRRLSSDGFEMHVAVDYLAAYGVTALLKPALLRGRARVINVASDSIRDTRQVRWPGRRHAVTLDPGELNDLSSVNPVIGFVPFQAYARAKLLTVMAGYDVARGLAADGVTVNAVHPGIVATGIVDLIPAALHPFRGLIRRALLSPEQGAAFILRLAIDGALQGVTGRYFARDAETSTPSISYDRNAQLRLREASDRFLAGDPAD